MAPIYLRGPLGACPLYFLCGKIRLLQLAAIKEIVINDNNAIVMYLFIFIKIGMLLLRCLKVKILFVKQIDWNKTIHYQFCLSIVWSFLQYKFAIFQ